jgi:hypothetical protein
MSEFPRKQRHYFRYGGMEYGAWMDVLINEDMTVSLVPDQWGALDQPNRSSQPADLYELLEPELKNVCVK